MSTCFCCCAGSCGVAVGVGDADVGGVIVVVLSMKVVHGTKGGVALKCLDRKGQACIGADGSNSGVSRF